MADEHTSRRGSGAALDVLLTDAAVGSPAARVLREPTLALSSLTRLARRPDRLAGRAAGLAGSMLDIARGRSEIAPKKSDKRFADAAWEHNWLFRRLMQGYLAVGQTADGVIDDAQLDWRADRLTRFFAHNVHDVLSPTNFPWSNPAVLKQTLDQGGANLVKGARRAGRDVAARRLPAMVDTSKFEVGGNIASTPGSVVHRADSYELIEYAPTTAEIHEVPLLVVPPTINKYYVLDLAPGRSVVEHLIAQGIRVFMVSWLNPTESEAEFGFDTYAAAVLEARAVAANIARSKLVNVAAACSGGLLSAGALGHLAAEGELGERVGSLTLMVCALDSERAGDASALAGRELAAAAVAESTRRGYLEGSALANVFAWLRPNDLVWGYVVNNYLMGKPPPAFDILYWNQDAVRLSAGLHRDFVEMALDNTMAHKDAMTVLDTPLDLRTVDLDAYVIAGLNDHIVPWENAFRGAKLLGGHTRFVLSTSGHIQALINPPGPKSRSSYRMTESLPDTPGELLDDVPTTSGSWWTNYSAWLAERSGAMRGAPRKQGNARHAAIEPAPGSYVHAA